jgi:protein phosphatase
MATSLTAAYIAGADLFFAHVGHSRAYLFRGGVLTQLTKDHTAEEPLGGRPAAWPDESTGDEQHVVTQSIGGSPCGPDITIEHVHLWNGDRVLLSTNGLTDVVGAETIAGILSARRRSADECQRLVDAAFEAGGKDDVTVLLADYRVSRTATTAPSTPPASTGHADPPPPHYGRDRSQRAVTMPASPETTVEFATPHGAWLGRSNSS